MEQNSAPSLPGPGVPRHRDSPQTSQDNDHITDPASSNRTSKIVEVAFGDFEQPVCLTIENLEVIHVGRGNTQSNGEHLSTGSKKPSSQSVTMSEITARETEGGGSRSGAEAGESAASQRPDVSVKASSTTDTESVENPTGLQRGVGAADPTSQPVAQQKATSLGKHSKTSERNPHERKWGNSAQAKENDDKATKKDGGAIKKSAAGRRYPRPSRVDWGNVCNRFPANSKNQSESHSDNKAEQKKDGKDSVHVQRNGNSSRQCPGDAATSTSSGTDIRGAEDDSSDLQQDIKNPSLRFSSEQTTGKGQGIRRYASSASLDSQSKNDTKQKPPTRKQFIPKSATREKKCSTSRSSHQGEKDFTPRHSNLQSSQNASSRFSDCQSRSKPRSRDYQTENETSRASGCPSFQTDKDSRRCSCPETSKDTRYRHSKSGKRETVTDSPNAKTRNDMKQNSSHAQKGNTPEDAEPTASSQKRSGARETELYIRVHQEFEDIPAFSSFINSKVVTGGHDIQVAREQFISRDGFTFYTLTCPSKNNAIKTRQHLGRDGRKAKPRIDCSFRKFPKLANETERIQEERNLMIMETVLEFNHRSDYLIRKCGRKNEGIERQIETEKGRLRYLQTHDDARQNIERLEQEQLELGQQLEEFKSSRDDLNKQLKSIDGDGYWKEVKTTEKRFRRECNCLEAALPIYGRRREILQTVADNPVTILLGETGSGKSTQLVQYVHDSGRFCSGLIVCTQPRRVAATSLAARVAVELQSTVGQEVGYKMGSRSKQSSATCILYTTDHSLLNECLTDPDLRKYSCIIVDEAHERSVHTDLLLSMIKKCLPKRPDLRVIITSATIDPHVFQEFFGGCPILRVTGRVFPVEVIWPKEDDENLQDNYCETAVQKVIEIHTYQPEGDILVFVTSPAETEKCSQLLKKKLKDARGAFRCFQLHGKQQPDDQQLVFQTLARRTRKIVFATNCAETSLTIDGIRYVVDTGMAKEMRFDPQRNLNALRLSLISQSSANQRKGRAGRTAPGTCYRLFSENIYDNMERVSVPEILKIHLGHALLKLAELGVSEHSYEFVQSPSEASIRKAFEMLESLGALKEGKMTEIGQWIAKLPFDPRLGLLTYLGRKQDMLYDTVVLAAVMSAEGGVFYRGTSEETQRLHDVTKTKFSTNSGDSLVSLAVYKDWLTVPDKQKNDWCMENGLNAKALRGARETVHEVCHILEVDSTSQKLSEEDDTEELRKMIVTCYATNLCHYLGQESAGYFAAHDSCRVHFHPSSCLNTLASVPEWVVFDKMIQTSRDFITGITPVEDSWLRDLDEQALGFNLEEIREKTIQKICTYSVGSRSFFNIVGPCYTKLRELEATFCRANSALFIEAIRELGQINIYSTEETDQTDLLRNEVNEIIKQSVENLEQEDREESIVGTRKNGVRVILGLGGQVLELLMPNQTRRVFIKKTPRSTTKEEVMEKFARYGEIRFCQQFEQGPNWGFLVFKTSKEAQNAALRLSENECLVGELERREDPRQDKTIFQLLIKFYRRPCQGHAIVRVAPDFFLRFLRRRTIYVDTVPVRISAKPRQRDHLRLENITNLMTEELIRRTLLHDLRQPEDAEGIVHDVFIPRQRPVLSEEDLPDVKYEVENIFRPYVRRVPEVMVRKPEEDHIMFTVHVIFFDPAEGYAAYEKVRMSDEFHSMIRRLTSRASAEGAARLDDYEDRDDHDQHVELRPLVRGEMYINDNTWELCQKDVEEAIRVLKNHQDVHVSREEGEHSGQVLIFKATSLEKVVQAKTYLDLALRGETVDCADVLMLFTAEGERILKEWETETGASVRVDKRFRKITIRGGQHQREEMRQRIDELIQREQASEEHCLRGPGKPAGLMKTLVVLHGEDLSHFLVNSGLLSAHLDFRRQRLKVTGSQESLQRASEMLTEVLDGAGMASNPADTDGGGSADGRAVLSVSVSIPTNQLHRLELCAHPYCRDCLRQQVHCAMADHRIPIQCCHEGCERLLALRDVLTLSRARQLDLNLFANAAVTAYVSSHPEDYRHCPTADCPAVYRTTQALQPLPWRYGYGRRMSRSTAPVARGHIDVFVCPACGASTCKGCNSPAHTGEPCPTSGPQDIVEKEVEDWAAEDADNRKRCPQCRVVIERMHGCNKMTCAACRTIFCFICRQSFASSQECYDHLVEKHGGIFPDHYVNDDPIDYEAERAHAREMQRNYLRHLRRANRVRFGRLV